jgi:glycosyltransferase involved in cell wall biosynthesis
VDGGSTDNTRELALGYGCLVLENAKTEPVNAKFIGFNAAHGKYIVYLDHDEELINANALMEMVESFRRHPNVRTVDSSGYVNPPGYSIFNEYINEFGDPFSFFMYRQSRGANFHLSAIVLKAKMATEDELVTVFSPSPRNANYLIENLAAGVATDLEFVRQWVKIEKAQDLGHLFILLNRQGASFAVSKNNPLRHYSSDTLKKFLSKIKWRVKNNIHHTSGVGAAGFHGRQSYQSKFFRYKKLLFIPYAFSLILPLADALWLMATRKKVLYLAHVGLTVYTAWLISLHMLLSYFGVKPEMRSYDEKKLIK